MGEAMEIQADEMKTEAAGIISMARTDRAILAGLISAETTNHNNEKATSTSTTTVEFNNSNSST
jgi:hypothetical protein